LVKLIAPRVQVRLLERYLKRGPLHAQFAQADAAAEKLREAIIERMRHGWSPEQVVGRLKLSLLSATTNCVASRISV
jgi:IS30 family transposase